MDDKNKIITAIQKSNYKIKSYGIKSLGIFGSFTKPKQAQKSDIDILVEFEKGKKTFDNYMELKFFLEKIFNKKVDLVIKESLKPKIKSEILKEVVYTDL